MNAKELIEILKTWPGDTPVGYPSDEYDIFEVEVVREWKGFVFLS